MLKMGLLQIALVNGEVSVRNGHTEIFCGKPDKVFTWAKGAGLYKPVIEAFHNYAFTGMQTDCYTYLPAKEQTDGKQ